MFRLRDEHVEALGPLFLESFEQAAIDDIRKAIPREVADVEDDDLRARLRSCVPRAASYGLVSNEDIVRFTMVSYLLGEGFDADPAHAWTATLLLSGDFPVQNKSRGLLLGAFAHREALAGRAPPDA